MEKFIDKIINIEVTDLTNKTLFMEDFKLAEPELYALYQREGLTDDNIFDIVTSPSICDLFLIKEV